MLRRINFQQGLALQEFSTQNNLVNGEYQTYLQSPRISPITTKLRVRYPPWINMYFVDFCSNWPTIKMDMATHPKPARKPAIAPQPAEVSASFKNIARLKAMTREKMKVNPKIFGMLAFFRSSSEKLFSFIQAFPKIKLEYQSPPIRKFDNAATTIANQFSVEISNLLKFIGITTLVARMFNELQKDYFTSANTLFEIDEYKLMLQNN